MKRAPWCTPHYPPPPAPSAAHTASPRPSVRKRPSASVRFTSSPANPAEASAKEGGENEAPPPPTPRHPRPIPSSSSFLAHTFSAPMGALVPQRACFLTSPYAGTPSRLPLQSSSLRKGAPLGRLPAGQHAARGTRGRTSVPLPVGVCVGGAGGCRVAERKAARGARPLPCTTHVKLTATFRNLFRRAQKSPFCGKPVRT